MSEITIYPLDGIEYDAADAAGYTATRTSGVYSSDNDFTVTAAGGYDVTVSAGQAWIRPERFVGYSVIKRNADTLTLPIADGRLPRIDRVVLRYDAATLKGDLTVLQGTPASTPTAPAISRTAAVYDLCLAEIRRPAGSTAITVGDITDTRLDEALCGLMRDGVTGIPTDELLAAAKERINALEENATASAGEAADSAMKAASSESNANQSATKAAASEKAAKEAAEISTEQANAAAESASAAGGSADAAAESAALANDKAASAEQNALSAKESMEKAAELVTPYTLPAATADTLGGVKSGENITNTDGTLSLTKKNVVDALGFTPGDGGWNGKACASSDPYSSSYASIKNADGVVEIYCTDGSSPENALTVRAGYDGTGLLIFKGKNIGSPLLKIGYDGSIDVSHASFIGLPSDIVSGDSSYVRFADGTQIHWGTKLTPSNSTTYTMTFSQAFANANYCALCTPCADISSLSGALYVKSRSNNSVTFAIPSANANIRYCFMLIGRWK